MSDQPCKLRTAPEHAGDKGGCVFPSSHRLLKKSEFRSVFDAGIKAVCRELVVLAIPAQSASRLGLVVSRKVGNAVVRNRVKRHLREAFRQAEQPEMALDLVVIARHICRESGSEDLRLAFLSCRKRLLRSPRLRGDTRKAD
ncbi:MAG: ribonuclease P protein component [Deltaproteobacteria bacterium]|nr:ribonuclease P protein component [Deltaproteobacteria bacterium]